MKELPKKLSKEIFINVDYAIARFKDKKKAYKTAQNPNMFCTFKVIQERNLPPQVQLHIRFHGKDEWYNDEDTLDIDLYFDESEVKKLDELKRGGSD